MAIITKPASMTKGTPMSFSLNKSELASLNEVSSNTYYSDMQNWQSILVKYKSSGGNQYEVLKFDTSNEVPTSNFSVSARALDLFEVQTIQIVDFDGGILTIGRGSLTTSDFDVDFSAPAAGGGGAPAAGGGGNVPAGEFILANEYGDTFNTFIGFGNWGVGGLTGDTFFMQNDSSWQSYPGISSQQFAQLQVGQILVVRGAYNHSTGEFPVIQTTTITGLVTYSGAMPPYNGFASSGFPGYRIELADALVVDTNAGSYSWNVKNP